MSVGITVRDDIHARWIKERDQEGRSAFSFSEWIDSLLYERDHNKLWEATVTQEGRITKTLAGKTILYRIKQEPNAISNTTTATEEK